MRYLILIAFYARFRLINFKMNKLEKIESVLYQLKSLSENSEEYISYYFNDIKTSVDLRRETLKQDIDSYSDQILDQIERTKGECIKISVKIRSISKELEVYTCEVDVRYRVVDCMTVDVPMTMATLMRLTRCLSRCLLRVGYTHLLYIPFDPLPMIET